jgi:hypothetical protein
MKRIFLCCAFLAAGLACLVAVAQAKPLEKSDSKIKASAKASKIGADGKQAVTITLDIDKGWYIYANPVGNKDYEDNQTLVTVQSKQKASAAVKYPAGSLKTTIVGPKKEKIQYRIYEGQVVLDAQVQRSAGDSGPLEISIQVNACDKNNCLETGIVKLTVK